MYLQLLLLYICLAFPLVRWIISSVTTTSFVILINGPTSQFFNPVGGLKQRSPLSLYLFVMVERDISKYIMEERRLRIVQGVHVGKREALSHLLFIDDVL